MLCGVITNTKIIATLKFEQNIKPAIMLCAVKYLHFCFFLDSNFWHCQYEKEYNIEK